MISSRSHMVASVLFAIVIVVISTLIVRSADASLPTSSQVNNQSSGNPSSFDDGYDSLPPGVTGFSYSTLLMRGLVHPPKITAKVSKNSPFQKNGTNGTLSDIIWNNPVNTSNQPSGDYGSTEPGAAMHPTNPLLALSGGNWNVSRALANPIVYAQVENSSNGGYS